ncbi:glycosyltransferase family 4 protein [Arthrobacter sp. KK5.5]|uniref:glycosyltransferase family 4 protein n=1 Tax=Arthrobacter sp. KK5.5 TaxID=3373084 RepID=UPI003EE670DF
MTHHALLAGRTLAARKVARTVLLAKNATLTARTVVDHLSDDPVVLALQAARRFRSAGLDRVLRVAANTMGNDASVANAVLRAIVGDDETLAESLRAAATTDSGDRRRCRLADVAIAVGNVDAAERLLAGVTADYPRAAGPRARLLWFTGNMTGAVEELQGAQGGAAKLRRRLESELRVFRGEPIRVRRRTAYVPTPERALHVLTNSLPHTGSGYAQRSQSTLVALRDRGWDVLAVTRIGYPVQVGHLTAADVEHVDGIAYRRLLPWQLADGMDQRLAQQARMLARVVDEFKPSVLHTTTHFVNAAVVRAVAEAFGIPWVYEVRGQLADTWASTRPESSRGSERYRLFREREAESAASADAVVTLGVAMREDLVDQGVPPDRITICPNAVGEAFLSEPRAAKEARVVLGLPTENEYVGTVTSVVAYEGLDDLVDAFGILSKRRPSLRLLIVGDGAALPRLKVQARQLGVLEHCIFTGRVPRELAPVYHQAMDIFVVPRKDLDVTRVVTPLKPVEASASRRPVVASDLPALAELVRDGVTGVLAEPGNPGALADTLDRLLDDPGKRSTLGDAGRAWVLRERTWSANAAKYAAVYGRITAERTSHPTGPESG